MNALGEGSHQDAADLDALVAETRILTNELKERIKQLEASSETGKDTTMRKDQVRRPFSRRFELFLITQWQFRLVRSKFLEAIQNYRMVELQRQTKARQRVERQFKIGMRKS
jgi:syntaxin 1B/2/3